MRGFVCRGAGRCCRFAGLPVIKGSSGVVKDSQCKAGVPVCR